MVSLRDIALYVNAKFLKLTGGTLSGDVTSTANVKLKYDHSAASSPLVGVHSTTVGGFVEDDDEGWHEIGAASEPAFQNSWVNFGGGATTAAFRKFPDGRAEIKGVIKSGTIGLAAFTLLASYRPGESRVFVVNSNGAFGTITINTDGTVVPSIGSNVFVRLDCSFFAEN